MKILLRLLPSFLLMITLIMLLSMGVSSGETNDISRSLSEVPIPKIDEPKTVSLLQWIALILFNIASFLLSLFNGQE